MLYFFIICSTSLSISISNQKTRMMLTFLVSECGVWMDGECEGVAEDLECVMTPFSGVKILVYLYILTQHLWNIWRSK